MIHSIEIDGYRGFDRFEMSDLGLVNLLVGGNNSGKTSVLEAIHILTSKGDPATIWQLLWRRGEHMLDDRPREVQPDLDICHLFTGHDLHEGSKIVLSAKNQSPKRVIEFVVAEPTPKEREKIRLEGSPARFPFVLHIKGSQVPAETFIPINSKGGIPSEAFEMPRRMRSRVSDELDRVQFITTESLNSRSLVRMWNEIALTPQEELVINAIRCLEPSIERIAPQSIDNFVNNTSRGGFKIKMKGRELPIPIGSMGDGMWRMLALAIAISRSKDGVLLVDEIDTGLHYSVMTQMWQLLYNAAIKLNVQIFATTHSSDCVSSLAKICNGGQDIQHRVTLNRIESGRNKSVPYNEAEIRTASERKIEVR